MATWEYGYGFADVESDRSDVVLHAWSAVRKDRTNMTVVPTEEQVAAASETGRQLPATISSMAFTRHRSLAKGTSYSQGTHYKGNV